MVAAPKAGEIKLRRVDQRKEQLDSVSKNKRRFQISDVILKKSNLGREVVQKRTQTKSIPIRRRKTKKKIIP